MKHITPEIEEKIKEFCATDKKLLVLTGAGLSVDSGIPTFRDTDRIWIVGSKNYMPTDMARFRMFESNPTEVWKWFIYRLGICKKALPNLGHFVISDFEKLFKKRFQLITQNVDGLHLAAGSSTKQTYQIHGTMENCRCGSECSSATYPFPELEVKIEEDLTDEQIAKLKCPKCGEFLRPNILFFDEYYTERRYKINSSLKAAEQCGMLLIVGTSGATTLPDLIVRKAIESQKLVIDINTKKDSFGEMAENNINAYSLIGTSSDILPEFLEIFSKYLGSAQKTKK